MFGSILRSLGVDAHNTVLLAPLAGTVIPLSEVKDQLFARGLLGQGVAIIPSGSRVVAPARARVEAIFPTGHAVALHTDDGVDVLIHIGLNTEELKGSRFITHVSEGDTVKQGDLLIEFDAAGIRSDGYDATVPIIICNSIEFSSIKGNEGQSVDELDELVALKAR